MFVSDCPDAAIQRTARKTIFTVCLWQSATWKADVPSLLTQPVAPASSNYYLFVLNICDRCGLEKQLGIFSSHTTSKVTCSWPTENTINAHTLDIFTVTESLK